MVFYYYVRYKFCSVYSDARSDSTIDSIFHAERHQPVANGLLYSLAVASERLKEDATVTTGNAYTVNK